MTTAEAFSCQELTELVTEYLEDALPPGERARFEQHLAECGNCEIYLEQIRATIALTGSLSPDELSPEAEEALLHAFRGWKSS
ncbi:MAG: zf-HC2 domain-containing protein [Actinobacteria bacterium]|nr:zf-HC2 domain-containing protein [Actinomycetota bacterium]